SAGKAAKLFFGASRSIVDLAPSAPGLLCMTTSHKPAMKRAKRGVPEGLWVRCPGCKASIYRKEAEKLLNVCPQCEYHFYVSAQDRIKHVLDDGTFEEWDAHLRPADPLQFADQKPYPERLLAEQRRTGLS